MGRVTTCPTLAFPVLSAVLCCPLAYSKVLALALALVLPLAWRKRRVGKRCRRRRRRRRSANTSVIICL